MRPIYASALKADSWWRPDLVCKGKIWCWPWNINRRSFIYVVGWVCPLRNNSHRRLLRTSTMEQFGGDRDLVLAHEDRCLTWRLSNCIFNVRHGLELPFKNYTEWIYRVMKFIMTVRDIQSSPGEGHAEDERTSDSESATQVIRTRGRPRKYFTDLDAADARRRRARDY